MDAELSLRCPVVAGCAVQDSYDVIYRGHQVGHIMRDTASSNGQWSWGNSRMPNELGDHGHAATFEEAKAAFLAAWLKPGDPLTRFYRLRERLGRAPDSAAIKPRTGLIAWDEPITAKT
ncbi:MAG: hypothetical protein OJF62_000319 [Pseudolabrys sp.]|jgi:hypothetical protein|nr:hypothetical protein [Pseudolabrys sp.]